MSLPGKSDNELEHPDELIVDEFDYHHVGYQLENTILSASVWEMEVRVWSGRNRTCWRVVHLAPDQTVTGQDYPVWEKPRIDIDTDKLR